MRIGIDLGGTKIEAAAIDEHGEVVERKRVPTPIDYDGLLDSIAALVRLLEGHHGAAHAVGVGTPGNHSPATGLMCNAENTALDGRPFAADLERALARPVRLANDAQCFALSEAIGGAGEAARVVFGVVLGTGAGAGLVIGGRVLSGHNGLAGEWAHNPLPWATPEESRGPRCYCGRHGCLEQYLSGAALSRDAGGVDARDVAVRAGDGDARCAGALARYADRLARALAVVVHVIDPDAIVLGGGVSNIDALYELVPMQLGIHIAGGRVDTPILRARYGDASGARGAAWLEEMPLTPRGDRAASGRPRVSGASPS